MGVLNPSECVNILEVCAFDWKTTRNAATGKYKCVIRDYFLSIVKSHRLGVGVYGRDSLFSKLLLKWVVEKIWRTYCAKAERSSVFDFEISGSSQLEFRRISDESFAQFCPEMS